MFIESMKKVKTKKVNFKNFVSKLRLAPRYMPDQLTSLKI
jgi:hypothetical protein